MNINNSNTTITIYKYPLRNNNWLPIYVFNVPYTSDEISKDRNFTISSDAIIKDPNNSNAVSADYFNVRYTYPYWAYCHTSPYDNLNVYLEVYSDEFFKFFFDSPTFSGLDLNTSSGFFSSDETQLASLRVNYLKVDTTIKFLYVCVLSSDGVYFGFDIPPMYATGSINDSIQIPVENTKGSTNSNVLFVWQTITKTINTSTITQRTRELMKQDYKEFNPNNPHSGGNQPDPDDGGDGDFDYTPDYIDIPDPPTISVTDSGMVSLYAPTQAQLKSLADYLWSDLFSIETFKKLLNNPMDAILGLYLIPVNVGTGAAREITVGNIVTTVSCNTVTTQFVSVDCGTFTFSKSAFTNSFLDWSPYTKCYLYLPFIGTQEINIDEFMGTTMHVVYHVDVLTGAMMCYVSNSSLGVIYEYMGQCAENVPLSSTSYSNTIGSIMSAAAAIGGVVATAVTGGAAAPVAAGAASTATAQAASSLKPSVAHSGNIGGGAGMMGVNYPYLIFITPRTSIPTSQYKYTGTPSNKVVKLSSLSGSGFNQIEAINLSVKGATPSEIAEIDSTLKGGVIL